MNREERYNLRLQELQKQKDKYFLLLLNIKNMNKNKINSILSKVDEKCKSKRTPKYSNEYYLYHICVFFTDLQKWESLKLIVNNCDKYHYKTIQDIHLLWSSLNIYNEAYNDLLKNSGKLEHKKSANLSIFIDTSDIYNKNGSEDTGYSTDPKKKKTRVSAICDENKTILSLIVTAKIDKSTKSNNNKNKPVTKTIKERVAIELNKKLQIIRKEFKKTANVNSLSTYDKMINKNSLCKTIDKDSLNKKINKKEITKFVAKDTLQYDSHTIEKTLDVLPIIECKKKKLIGDAGYSRTQKDKDMLLETYNVELLYPQRKNEHKKTPLSTKKLMKKRYVIENVFQKLKRFDRVCVRKDKLTTTFNGFLLLATILTFKN